MIIKCVIHYGLVCVCVCVCLPSCVYVCVCGLHVVPLFCLFRYKSHTLCIVVFFLYAVHSIDISYTLYTHCLAEGGCVEVVVVTPVVTLWVRIKNTSCSSLLHYGGSVQYSRKAGTGMKQVVKLSKIK